MSNKLISVHNKGDFNNTTKLLLKLKKITPQKVLEKYGQQGVQALQAATPKNTGKTASSWYWEIQNVQGSIILRWNNSNVVDNWCNVAVMLQYGHGTRNGGYVEGTDYINPAMQPIFQSATSEIWNEVKSCG